MCIIYFNDAILMFNICIQDYFALGALHYYVIDAVETLCNKCFKWPTDLQTFRNFENVTVD